MKALAALKVLAVVFAVIIIVLLGVLFFYNPAKAPQLPPIASADGHLAVTSPWAGALIASPITIIGTVTGGGWFFEGSFPIKIVDSTGAVIGRGVAQAQADWTSTSSVPFTVIINFTAPHTATGAVVFSKDNPSGAPQNGMSLSIPVRFK